MFHVVFGSFDNKEDGDTLTFIYFFVLFCWYLIFIFTAHAEGGAVCTISFK